MRLVRDAIPVEERARRATTVRARLFELPAVREAGTLLLFSSFGSEISTAGIIERLLDDGRRVLLPYLDGPVMSGGELRRGDALIDTAYGPREPAVRLPVDPAEIDVAIAPGLAFDREGHRLGYGRGHYDRYLGRLREDAAGIGVAFHEQLVSEVPHGSKDRLLDMVVTDQETIVRARP